MKASLLGLAVLAAVSAAIEPASAAYPDRQITIVVPFAAGGTTDIVGLSLPVFFVRTAADFLAFLKARIPDPETGQLDPAKVGAFLAEPDEALHDHNEQIVREHFSVDRLQVDLARLLDW